MPGVVIKIQGLNKLRGNFEASPRLIDGALKRAVKTSVNFIRPIMRKESPVDTGALRRNTYAMAKGFYGEVAPNLEVTPYALFVHEGTRFIKPNPFIIRTGKLVEAPVQKIFANTLNRIVKKIAI